MNETRDLTPNELAGTEQRIQQLEAERDELRRQVGRLVEQADGYRLVAEQQIRRRQELQQTVNDLIKVLYTIAIKGSPEDGGQS